MAQEHKHFREPEHNKYVPAELSEEENELKTRILELKDSIAESRRKLQEALDSCKHKVFYDDPGIPYTLRFCSVCGKKLETI